MLSVVSCQLSVISLTLCVAGHLGYMIQKKLNNSSRNNKSSQGIRIDVPLDVNRAATETHHTEN
jgi:hypothetical protein